MTPPHEVKRENEERAKELLTKILECYPGLCWTSEALVPIEIALTKARLEGRRERRQFDKSLTEHCSAKDCDCHVAIESTEMP